MNVKGVDGALERAIILGELVKEVLGPRNGLHETFRIDMDPRNEYITGVLAPKESNEERDVDAEAELMTDGDDSDEDEGSVVIEASYTGSPSLDPKSLPKSLGLSVIVETDQDDAKMEVCFTWARYETNGSEFSRESFFEVKEFQVNKAHHWVDKVNSGVEFTIKSVALKQGRYKVSVFLVNNTKIGDDLKPVTPDFIFQPEIRLICNNGTSICPLESNHDTVEFGDSEEIQEEHSLDLIYRERKAFARGHLVGVTWKEIDIQREHPKKEALNSPPFIWTDGDNVPVEIRRKFIYPDVRTDYTPTYPVEAPSMVWRESYGPSPEFNPEILAETWNPVEIKENLNPFVRGYKKWLEEQKHKDSYNQLNEKLQLTANLHFSNIEKSINRMERSIQLIVDDEDVRLAFCFANKAMALQSIWGNKRVNSWRPFQLAFILINIASIADPTDPDREVADLLWFATGGGKTESYLGLAAFTIALQRRRASKDRDGHKRGAGVNVLSRYTLRLLTIQQFRRALRVVTASEYLRVANLQSNDMKIGWRPNYCTINDDFIWGSERFSIGLWVGGGVTPNGLHSIQFRNQNGELKTIPGAFDLIKSKGRNSDGEPAQVLNCPCCNEYVAIPNEGLGAGKHKIHFVFRSSVTQPTNLSVNKLNLQGATITDISIVRHNQVYYTMSVAFDVLTNNNVESDSIDDLWRLQIIPELPSVNLLAARPTRPGYFFHTFVNSQKSLKECNFEIICPNPDCDLNQKLWAEKVPTKYGTQHLSASSDMEYQDVLSQFQVDGEPNFSSRIVIPAYTVDDQIYHRCPSMIIATADKFAQLPSEPRAATLFGGVEYYHARSGYYRENCPPNVGGGQASTLQAHPSGYSRNQQLHKRVQSFDPPLLIIQDELHLIEGPLGSLYGLYETAIDALCTKYTDDGKKISPKYIVSTATVRQAAKQVKTLFARDFAQFPPSGIDVNDNFFSTGQETHPIDDVNAGRLYVGICAPGKGAQTPIVRIWSSMLQIAHELKQKGVPDHLIDGFTTVVGYFNAIRELAGAASLYRQDIPERMDYLNGANTRSLSENPLELSSRKSSTELPGLLEMLENSLDTGSPEDGVLATSMFGTGVDVDRLRLMIINGQPKSTSSYIQASGRVGRKKGGLVVTFFRASRPRDLDHYEFFTGYHRALYKYVEPVTVAPFSPRAREKALGPLSVALLRQASTILGVRVPIQWRHQQKLQRQVVRSAAEQMRFGRYNDEVLKILEIFANRIAQLPDGRRPEVSQVMSELRSELDRWYTLAQSHGSNLLFNESSMARVPTHPVVLGDPQHYFRGLEVAFENSPQSLRDVEGTTNFKS
ncbi:DISARM system helicase DrmA [Paenibacillus sp. CC-CFT742]|nr:DISARM system helicase DrmA [Paenibacillus sp. CC-CFT742]WJH31341.1 DISARM system helicase DrmA [Paenibacillus sp. CC-CFT742]